VGWYLLYQLQFYSRYNAPSRLSMVRLPQPRYAMHASGHRDWSLLDCSGPLLEGSIYMSIPFRVFDGSYHMLQM
jgi:hypothetical protein